MSEQDSQLPVKQEENNVVSYELTAQSVADHLKKIEDAMRLVMKQDVDYGIIPGCQKPSLLQSGAEKLSTMFRLAPQYTVTKEWLPEARRDWTKKDKKGTTIGFIRYEVNCQLVHGPTGNPVASGLGVSNNFEPKFISRDPYEVEETVLQFARKRAFVNAMRTGTAASALFTQDIEDMPQGVDDAPPFRNDKIGFGKHRDETWAEVQTDWLEWIVEQPDKPGSFVSRDGKLSNKDKAKFELAYRQQQGGGGGTKGVPASNNNTGVFPPAEEEHFDETSVPF